MITYPVRFWRNTANIFPGFAFHALGHFVPKVRSVALASGSRQEDAARQHFGTTCPEVAGFGEAPQQGFLRSRRNAKTASVATLALLAVSAQPGKGAKIEIALYYT